MRRVQVVRAGMVFCAVLEGVEVGVGKSMLFESSSERVVSGRAVGHRARVGE